MFGKLKNPNRTPERWDRPLPGDVAADLSRQAGVPAEAVAAAWAARRRVPPETMDPAKEATLTDAFGAWMGSSVGVADGMDHDAVARAAFIHGMRFGLQRGKAAKRLWAALRANVYTDDDPQSVAYLAGMDAQHKALEAILERVDRFDLLMLAAVKLPDGTWEGRPFTRETAAGLAPALADGSAKLMGVNVEEDGTMRAVRVGAMVYDGDDENCPCPRCTARRAREAAAAAGESMPSTLPPGTIVMPGPKNPV